MRTRDELFESYAIMQPFTCRVHQTWQRYRDIMGRAREDEPIEELLYQRDRACAK